MGAHSRQIPSFWFYMGFLVCMVFAVGLAIHPDSSTGSAFLSLIFLAVGTLFLLEPLHRLKKLPQWVERWYDKSQFFVSIVPRKTFAPYLLAITALPLLMMIRIWQQESRAWAPLIFVTIVFSFLFLVSLVMTIASYGGTRIKSIPGISRVMLEIEDMALTGVRAFSDVRSFTRIYLSLIFLALTYGSAFLVSTQLPTGKYLGPIFLFLIFVGSYGNMILTSRVNSERLVLESELNTAREMQLGLMPMKDPDIEGFDISGICMPANEVGGDFYDYVWMNEKRSKLGIAVADVSGKAMKAAITAVMTSGMIYRELEGNQWPKTILQRINKPMYAKLNRGSFTTMLFAVLETRKRTLSFSNAGQMRPILKRGARTEYIKMAGLPLGVKENVVYHETKVTLKRGDVVVFYTDGINEAMNAHEEEYGLQRLESHIHQLSSQFSARQCVESILADVRTFVGPSKQNDDMTIVVLRVV